ncbi:tumor necrosis factor ligand superfamily member 13 isoform X2 [Lissotriton helveticus]
MGAARQRQVAVGYTTAGPWLVAGTLVLALACFLGLVVQSFQLAGLQEELERLKREMVTMTPPAHYDHDTSRIFAKQRNGKLSTSLDIAAIGARSGTYSRTGDLPREKREANKGKKQPSKKKRSIVHLVPASLSSNDEKDLTELEWKPFLSQGSAFEVRGKAITLDEGGLYLVYSQVLYNDSTFTMGHIVTRWPDGDADKAEELFRCIQSMPGNEEIAYNSCYSGGVFKLHKGDVIRLHIPRTNASVDMKGNATFLGLVKL